MPDTRYAQCFQVLRCIDWVDLRSVWILLDNRLTISSRMNGMLSFECCKYMQLLVQECVFIGEYQMSYFHNCTLKKATIRKRQRNHRRRCVFESGEPRRSNGG